MIAIQLSFLTGRYHATRWGHNINDGHIDWPPSPWRIIRAIISSWKSYHPDDDVWPAIHSLLADNPHYVLPSNTGVGHTRHYVPIYNKKTEKVLDSFILVDKNNPLYIFWNCELSNDHKTAFIKTIEKIRYVGRAESWCEAKAVTDVPSKANCLPSDTHIDGWETTKMLVPDHDATLDDLTVTSQDLKRNRLRIPNKTHYESYVLRHVPQVTYKHPYKNKTVINVIRCAILPGENNMRPHVKNTILVGSLFKKSVLSVHKKLNPGNHSITFSGRNNDGSIMHDNHSHAHYIPTDEDDDGFLDTLTVISSRGFSTEEHNTLKHVRHIYDGKNVDCETILIMQGRIDTFRIPMFGRSRRWRSLTPYTLSKHIKIMSGGRIRNGPESQIADEIMKRGLPNARVLVYDGKTKMLGHSSLGTYGQTIHSGEIDIGRFPAISFRRYRKDGLVGIGSYAIRLEFDTDVQGPISLGHGSHYGMGLFVPEGT